MPRSINSTKNPALLAAALEGLELQKARVEEQIDEVRRVLANGATARQIAVKPAAKAAAPKESNRKPLSAAARKRISAAQKRRWAAYRKQTNGRAGGSKTAKKAGRAAS